MTVLFVLRCYWRFGCSLFVRGGLCRQEDDGAPLVVGLFGGGGCGGFLTKQRMRRSSVDRVVRGLFHRTTCSRNHREILSVIGGASHRRFLWGIRIHRLASERCRHLFFSRDGPGLG